MSPLPSDFFLKTATDLAQTAAQAVMECLHQPLNQKEKADHSPVTDADLRSDEILREGLSQAFPDHAILTEENGIIGPQDSDFVWMIDPLDGTKAFIKGIPGFCVMVGLLYEGKPYLGVVIDPIEGRLYQAVQGQGAFQIHQGRKTAIHVSARNQLSTMPIVVSTGFPEEIMQPMHAFFGGPLLEPINSVGIKVGLVVRQEADIYISHHPVSYWDTCAPQIILEEAGGILTRLDGSRLDYSLKTPFAHESLILATNGTCHETAARFLQNLFKG